ncbi:MAG TPA: hypothetical protein VMZ53_15540 [Kofleriaceae bacterium]|nr:hypothetical protein [Kofleriaceae bacterium]
MLASSLLATHAFAETQAEIAARENEEGKQLMFENKYSEASAKFMSAHSRVPEPKYFFNHCTSLFWEGKFGESLTACNAADKNADDKLKAKIAAFEDKIKAEAQKQGVVLQPVGGGAGPGETPPVGTDPNNPNGNPPGPGPTGPSGQPPPSYGGVGRAPSMGLFSQSKPENKYAWSLGIDIFGGGGRIGQPGYFGHAAGGFRLKSDYLLNPKMRLGTQGYFQISNYGNGDEMGAQGAYSLGIFDLGIAGYKHICGPHSRFCLTPLVGVQLALLSPANQTDSTGDTVFNYASLGARLEMAASLMLGSRYQHVISGIIGLNAYTQAFSEPADCSPGFDCKEDWGLDKGGAAFYLGAGYTYRFSTPFGSAPFVTLE